MCAARFTKILPWIALIGVLVVIDQGIKYLIVTTMALGERIPIVPFFDLLYARNFGVAFSMFGAAPDLFLVILTSAITIFVAFLLWRTPSREVWTRLAFALILSGALGNLIDRIRLGYVIDYVYFNTPSFDFAIFNAADAFIFCGAALLIIDELFLKNNKQHSEDQL